MNQLIIEQAVEIYLLGLELAQQHEKLVAIYDRGYDIGSCLFTGEYLKLSEMTTRYMQLEMIYNELINKAPVLSRHNNSRGKHKKSVAV